MRYFYLFFALFFSVKLAAQTDSTLWQPATEDLLESFAQDQGDDAAFDYNDLNDRLAYYLRRPLDLNKATASDLDEFFFLDALQRQSILLHREKFGDFISIYELQAVPGLDMATVRQLAPFFKVNEPGLLERPSELLRENRSQLILRWGRQLEDKKGFQPVSDSLGPAYLGDPNQLYLRYRLTVSNKISLGITAEKDAGEEFFTGSNKQGFDFYSAHVFLRNPIRRVKTLALGDFAVSMGQGLLLFQGFAPKKSALTTTVARSGNQLRPFSSVSEFDFFRGGAAQIGLAKKLDLLVFASSRKRDANLDTEAGDDPDDPVFGFASSLQTSGLHRTRSEIEDEGAIRQNSAGATLKYSAAKFRLAFNCLYEHLDKPLVRNPQLYNQFYFNGSQLLNTSVDYAFFQRNFYFFGETARSQNGAIATLNGLLLTLDRRTDVAVVHRYLPRDFQALNPKPFAETAGGLNEQGIYFGMQVQPHRQWRLNAYFDTWKHPWARFLVDAPSQGYEWLGRVSFTIKRRLEAYVQARNETKEVNSDLPDTPLDQLATRTNRQFRLQLNYKLNKSLEWRSRFDWGFSETDGDRQSGMALSQDFIFTPQNSNFRASTRFAIFETDGYDIRFYSYERDVMNAFSIPAYYDQGTRFYLNIGYRLHRQVQLEGRYEVSYFSNLSAIGSGQEQINGNRRSEVKLQVRWSF